jgi:hypothetical protein
MFLDLRLCAGFACGKETEIERPPLFSLHQRYMIHLFCEAKAVGSGSRQSLIVKKIDATTPTIARLAVKAALDDSVIDENWIAGRPKYDSRHWMANWFVMAVSKDIPLYRQHR